MHSHLGILWNFCLGISVVNNSFKPVETVFGGWKVNEIPRLKSEFNNISTSKSENNKIPRSKSEFIHKKQYMWPFYPFIYHRPNAIFKEAFMFMFVKYNSRYL